MAQDSGAIDAPIGLDLNHAIARKVDFGEGGDSAITHYQVVERYPTATKVRLQLETGRTHQIRVHLAWLGYPIFGDSLYGIGTDMQDIPRQALHATYLRIYHPRYKEWKEWESTLPLDMCKLIETLQRG
jgi:23S rRNA pseudouridine1911/1915/1917 synthase